MTTNPATLAELIRDVAQRDGGKPALIFADQPISYPELDALIENAANGLAARGVTKGDRVALLVPNIPEFVVAYYAILRCGGIVVPINVLYKAEEIAYVLQDSEAIAFILFADFAPQASPVQKRRPQSRPSSSLAMWRPRERSRGKRLRMPRHRSAYQSR